MYTPHIGSRREYTVTRKSLPYTLLSLVSSFVISVLLCTSCTLERSGNGKLDGMWHLEQVDTMATGGVLNLMDKHLYWSFQGSLLQLEDKDEWFVRALMRFERTQETLRVYEPYYYNREEGDQPMEDATQLNPYGVNQTDETMAVEQLDGKHLTLRSSMLRLHFRRF